MSNAIKVTISGLIASENGVDNLLLVYNVCLKKGFRSFGWALQILKLLVLSSHGIGIKCLVLVGVGQSNIDSKFNLICTVLTKLQWRLFTLMVRNGKLYILWHRYQNFEQGVRLSDKNSKVWFLVYCVISKILARFYFQL